jgi:dolichol-phosphate mannosyltransferase
MNNTMDLSIVIPVYNEAENLEPLLEELTGILNQLDKTSEIICVNDASTDDSLGILNRLAAKFPQLRILTHGINSGESAGQATGFRSAAGDVIITMDADMQNDPGDIPRLLKALTGEVACVCGVRKIREDDAVRRVSSYIANKFRNFITGDAVSDAGCTFRAIRRPVLREMIVFNGMHRFLSTILRAQCYRVVEIPINHRARHAGQSKYGIGNRLWRGILDCFAMRWYKARAVNGNRLETNQAVDGSLL